MNLDALLVLELLNNGLGEWRRADRLKLSRGRGGVVGANQGVAGKGRRDQRKMMEQAQRKPRLAKRRNRHLERPQGHAELTKHGTYKYRFHILGEEGGRRGGQSTGVVPIMPFLNSDERFGSEHRIDASHLPITQRYYIL